MSILKGVDSMNPSPAEAPPKGHLACVYECACLRSKRHLFVGTLRTPTRRILKKRKASDESTPPSPKSIGKRRLWKGTRESTPALTAPQPRIWKGKPTKTPASSLSTALPTQVGGDTTEEPPEHL